MLVISARKGEFETGVKRGGQTREHTLLVKTAGVSKIVCVVNKMDDLTVGWQKERYEEIKDKLGPFIRAAGVQSEDGRDVHTRVGVHRRELEGQGREERV